MVPSGEPSLDSRHASPSLHPRPRADFVARQLLRRTGVVFRKTIERERMPVLPEAVTLLRAVRKRQSIGGSGWTPPP